MNLSVIGLFIQFPRRELIECQITLFSCVCIVMLDYNVRGILFVSFSLCLCTFLIVPQLESTLPIRRVGHSSVVSTGVSSWEHTFHRLSTS